MTSLLDVNLLVALFDPLHVHHEAAHRWFEVERGNGWATCPLTENGFVRVVSHPSYPGRRTTVEDAVRRLSLFRSSDGYVFWSDDVSLCDSSAVDFRHLRGHQQVTDLYLLLLAAHRRGRLATLDRRIRAEAVATAPAGTLLVVEA